jgi:hypothetical protein
MMCGTGGIETLGRGERRFDARHRALALKTREQTRLVSRDVTPGTTVDDHLEIESRVLDVLAQEAVRVRVVDGLLEAFGAEPELTPDVDERVVRLDRVRRDRRALDDLVRITLDEHVVFERRRLTLVGVDREVAREDVLREERPLLARAEPGAAATTQPRGLDLLDDLGRLHPECLLERRVRLVVLARRFEGPRVLLAGAQELGDDARLLDRHQAAPPVLVPDTVRAVSSPC